MLRLDALCDLAKSQDSVNKVWTYTLERNVDLAMVDNVGAHHLMVNWSSKGVGYALYAGHPIHQMLICLNSHGIYNKEVNLIIRGAKSGGLGNIGCQSLVQGRKLVLWIDLEGVFHRLIRKYAQPKKLMDNRVRMLY